MKAAEKFAGTVICDILTAVDSLYNDIDENQKIWKAKSPMQCPDGCGSCCVHFEPEVYEAEALFLAAWMLENQSERAERIVEAANIDAFVGGDGCVLVDYSVFRVITAKTGQFAGSRVSICRCQLKDHQGSSVMRRPDLPLKRRMKCTLKRGVRSWAAPSMLKRYDRDGNTDKKR